MFDPRQHAAVQTQEVLSRRGFLGNVYTGLAGIGVAHLLGEEQVSAENAGSFVLKPDFSKGSSSSPCAVLA